MFLRKPFFSFGDRLGNLVQLRLCHSLVRQQGYSAPGTLLVLALCLVIGGGLSSCQKVIDVSLNDAEKKYVIEAVVTDQDTGCQVLLSQTKNFSDDNTFNGVSGATITISDNNQSPVTLVETSPGVYTYPGLKGSSGHTYSLNISVGGKTFSASSTMPQLVTMDSLYITERDIFGKINKVATVQSVDPPGIGNAYRYVQYVNGVKEKTIFVINDDYSDGRVISRDLLFFTDDDEDKIKTGDTVRIDMLCIDNAVYKYWFSLDQSATGNNNSAAPSNPVTNIVGGALGYFSAHTVQSRTIVSP